MKFAAFLSSLSWPGEVVDLGAGGISYVELLILYERWAGERLLIEESVPKLSAAPLCPDADIWKLCRFLGHMFSGPWLGCLVVWVGSFLGELVPTMGG